MEAASPLNAETLLRHQEFVLRLARTLVRGNADAEEVAQRTFVSALESPPAHGGVRSWLARVTRNHALDLHRTDRRRAERERRGARNEAVAAEKSAMEQLELEHGVVRAVLALEEPYKSVVVATYYEGLAPAEIAARRGVPAGTVRSQLTRAHALLAERLDSDHGDRRTWTRGLVGLLSARDATVTTATATTWPLVLGGLAAVVLFVVVLRFMSAPKEPQDLALQAPANAAGPSAEIGGDEQVALAAVEQDTRQASAETRAPATSGAEPDRLLERSRQIKALILARRLEVDAEDRERFAWLADVPKSGIVNVLERERFATMLTLPWAREGGVYFSFTENIHDFNRRPQVVFEGGDLGVRSSGMIVDLGVRGLNSVPTHALPVGLDSVGMIEWDAAWGPVGASPSGGDAGLLRAAIDAAKAQGRIDPATLATVERRTRTTRIRPVAGHAYLLRAFSREEHDIVVAIEVVRVTPDACTIAWRLLDERSVTNPREPWTPRTRADEVPAAPTELAALSEEQLLTELARVRADAESELLEHFTPEVEARFGALRDRKDAGLVRLVRYLSEWTELPNARQGAACYSFVERSHTARTHDLIVQGYDEDHDYALQSNGHGAFVDLGMVPLDSVDVPLIKGLTGKLGTLLVDHDFADDPKASQWFDSTFVPPPGEHVIAREFGNRLEALGGKQAPTAIAGHTYALRVRHVGSHDILVALHVAEIDRYGAVIAWRLLKSWPVAEKR